MHGIRVGRVCLQLGGGFMKTMFVAWNMILKADTHMNNHFH